MALCLPSSCALLSLFSPFRYPGRPWLGLALLNAKEKDKRDNMADGLETLKVIASLHCHLHLHFIEILLLLPHPRTCCRCTAVSPVAPVGVNWVEAAGGSCVAGPPELLGELT